MFHLQLDIKGVLMQNDEEGLKGLLRDESGRVLNGHECKKELLDALIAGKRYMRIGECVGFSEQDGCPGHDAA